MHEAIWYTRIEASSALLVAFFINLAVVATNALNFYEPDECAAAEGGPFACMSASAFAAAGGENHAEQGAPCNLPGGAAVGAGKCGSLGLAAEGYALSQSLGPAALYIWSIGLLAAGQAATMKCTYAGQVSP